MNGVHTVRIRRVKVQITEGSNIAAERKQIPKMPRDRLLALNDVRVVLQRKTHSVRILWKKIMCQILLKKFARAGFGAIGGAKE